MSTSRRNEYLEGKVYIGGLPEDATSQEVTQEVLTFDTFFLCLALGVSALIRCPKVF